MWTRATRRWRRLTAVIAMVAVAAIPALATGTPSQAATPTSLPAILSAPRGIGLTMEGSTPVISWSPVIGAASYRVEISGRITMSKPTRLSVTAALARPGGQLADTTYFVRVAAVASGSTTPGTWSVVTRATTSTAAYRYRAPSLSSPSRTATSVTLSWSSLGSGLRYQVQRSTSALMSNPTSRYTSLVKKTIGSLTPATSYWWRGRVVSTSGQALGPWSAPIKRTTLPATESAPAPTPEPAPEAPPVTLVTKALVVGSYNVTCYTCGGSAHPWTARRAAVAATIRLQSPDILGVQEASPSKVSDRGITQFLDLAGEVGSPYKLTSSATAEGRSNRILYDSTSIEILDSGYRELPNSGDYGTRWVVWALARQKATGKRFFFANTHLDPGRYLNDIRIRQTNALLEVVKAHRPAGVPSIVVGDFNSHKWTPEANAAYDVMLANGYVDPLGNAYQSKWSAPGATVEKRIHTNFYSFNGFASVPKQVPYYNGIHIDYIFVTPMRVSEYETVVDVDAAGVFVGTIPSDHNMLRATVWLP